jgi:general secretion pathway protein D
LPVIVEYDPNVVTIQEVRQGDFLSGGGEPIAVVQRNDEQQGRSIISATRPPNISGVSGSGPVLEIVVRGVASGTSHLSIGAANATTSRHARIGLLADPATIEVPR